MQRPVRLSAHCRVVGGATQLDEKFDEVPLHLRGALRPTSCLHLSAFHGMGYMALAARQTLTNPSTLAASGNPAYSVVTKVGFHFSL